MGQWWANRTLGHATQAIVIVILTVHVIIIIVSSNCPATPAPPHLTLSDNINSNPTRRTEGPRPDDHLLPSPLPMAGLPSVLPQERVSLSEALLCSPRHHHPVRSPTGCGKQKNRRPRRDSATYKVAALDRGLTSVSAA